MRKYFLLSTVALATMVASEARAYDYLKLRVDATIKDATTTVPVSSLDFGTIVIDGSKVTGDITITVSSDYNSGTVTHTGSGVLAVLGAKCAKFDNTSWYPTPLNEIYHLPDTIELSGSEGNSEKLTITDLNIGGNHANPYCIGGTLNIPAYTAPDFFTGSFTFQRIY
ncbi:MAG: DUF4402 domain-containing protein [Alphaproteobacteria bacterium]|nr:DUF4402 domain-containing protein [Alphaproteobacteria bacterium]